MSQKTDISLKNFFIFNSNFAPKEGEEEQKILFYYPSRADTDTKIKEIGLSEAIIQFTSSFTTDEKSCESLHTQKTSQLFFQPEKDYWMVMTVNVPYEIKSKEKIDYKEYKGDDVHDSVFRAVLKQSYNMFRLFMGTFESNFVGDDIPNRISNLITKLEHFYSKYVLTLKLQYSDILDVFQSIQYLPLNQLLFLRVHNFISMIESTFPTIKNSIFLYNEQVIWSGINPTDLYCIYEYLIGTLFPNTSSTELQGGSIPKRFSLNSSHYGTFITGPESYDNCLKPPKMFIFNDNKCEEYYFVVYKALSGTLCLFMKEMNFSNDDLFQELHTFIGPQLTNIASEIGESFMSQSPVQTNNDPLGPKYLYFNELSLKHNGTFHIDNRKMKSSTLPMDVMYLITDLFEDKNTELTSVETIVKTLTDYWIIKRSSNARHFFVVINKSSTLLEITDEAKKVFDQHLKNVFFEKP